MSRKMRSESEKLERNNRDMEDRLREIKQLFEHEQVKREKEALIWSSAGDGKRRKAQIDSQARKILGKGVHTLTAPPDGGRPKSRPKYRVLKDEPLNLPKRSKNEDLANFIDQQRARMVRSKKSPKSRRPADSVSPPVPTPPTHPPPSHLVPPLEEEYALLGDQAGSEIFELPLSPEGHLNIQVVRSVSSSRAIGIYTQRDGRKRLMLPDESGMILRPSGGWKGTFFPLVPPRSSRPSTADNNNSNNNINATQLNPRTQLKAAEEKRNYLSPRPPSVPKGVNLLDGSFDEERNAAEFKAAVESFRNGRPRPKSATTEISTTEISTDEKATSDNLDEKLTQIGEMFEKRNNLTAMERILLQKSKGNSYKETTDMESRESVPPELTEEEEEMQEERKRFREMLIGTQSARETPKRPEEHQLQEPAKEPSPTPQQHSSVPEMSPMWLPTPHLEFEAEMPELTSDEAEVVYAQMGEMYQEHTRTIFDDGTVVNNIITVETGMEDSASDEDSVEWNHPAASAYYDSEDQLDSDGFEEELKMEAMRIIDEHARRYADENAAGMAEGNVRPASRASVVTDADLETDSFMTSQMDQVEQKYLPDDDEYDN